MATNRDALDAEVRARSRRSGRVASNVRVERLGRPGARSGRRPARAARPPCAGRGRSGPRWPGRRRRRAGGWSWCRSRWRPRVSSAPACHPGRRAAAGGQQEQRSGRQVSRMRASASSPSGLTPGPAASACPTRTCRHLTRVGMPPGRDAGDLRHVPELLAPGEVVLVRAGVPRGEVGVLVEPRGPLRMRPPASSVLTAATAARGGQVVRRRERCPVVEARAVRTTSGRPHTHRAATSTTPRGTRPSCSASVSRSRGTTCSPVA